MSEKPIIKELGLEKYFCSILDSSQEENSNSKSSSSRRSQIHDNDIEKMRGTVFDDKFNTQDVARAYQFPQIKVLDALYTPSPFDKKMSIISPDQCMMENAGHSFLSNKSLKTATSIGRTPSVCFEKKQLDNEFLKFDPSIYNSSDKKAISNNTALKEDLSLSKTNTKAKSTPVKEFEEVLTKKRTNSLDEADIAMISQMLQQDKKESPNTKAFDMLEPIPNDSNHLGSDQNESEIKSSFPATPLHNHQENDLVGPSTASQNAISKASLEKIAVMFENEEEIEKSSSKVKNSQLKDSVSTKNSQALFNIKSQIQIQANLKERLDATAKSTLKWTRESLEKVKSLYENNSQDYLDYFLDSPEGTENNNNNMEIEPTLQMTQTQLFSLDNGTQSKPKVVSKKSPQKDIPKPLNIFSQNEPMLTTASGKSINVNNEALKNILNMFEDNSQNVQFTVNDTPDFNPQFVSANLTSFKQPAVKNSKSNAFQDTFEDDFGEVLQTLDAESYPEPQITTASRKPIQINEEKLQGIMKMFEDGSQKDIFSFGNNGKSNPASNSNNMDNNRLQGFKDKFEGNSPETQANFVPALTTASLKPVYLNKDKLKAFENMFEKFSQEDNAEDTSFNQEPTLKTASNKPIQVDYNKAKVFQNMFEDNSQEENMGTITSKEEPMLTTASMKPIKVNLKKAQQFKDLFEGDTPEKNVKSDHTFNIEPTLTTASMKPIQVDNEKAKAFQNMFEDFSHEENDNGFNQMPMLATGNMKPIQVDNEKIKAFKNMFEDFSQEDSMNVEASESFPSFTTGNMKSIPFDNSNFTTTGGFFKEDSQKGFTKSVDYANFTKFNLNPQKNPNQKVGFEQYKMDQPPMIQINKQEDNFSHNNKKLGNRLESESSKLQIKSSNLAAAFRLFNGGGNSPKSDDYKEKISPNQPKYQPSKFPGKFQEKGTHKSFEQPEKLITKRVLTEDIRNKKATSPGIDLMDALSPNSEGNLPVMLKSQIEAKEHKKTQAFKFVKGNENSNKPASSLKPSEEKTEITEKVEKNPLKRNYSDFKKGVLKEEDFEHNQKIQAYHRASKNRKSKAPLEKQTYFYKGNLKRKNFKPPSEYSHITISNSVDHKFLCPCANYLQSQFSAGSPQSDYPCYCGGNLAIGWNEVRHELLKTSLHEDFLTEDWVKWQYRMIVWKLASIERKLFNYHPSKQLTFDNVKMEIEYRYYIGYILGKRSTIQKVIEKDQSSTSHLVLLVGEIISQQNCYLVELSDGWNSVYFQVNFETSFNNDKNTLTNNQLFFMLIKSKKLYSGMKLHIMGMKVLDSKSETNEDEKAPERTLVEIQYNSICKAKWDEKLGLSKSKHLLRNLASLRNNGGFVPMIDVFIVKKYKLLERASGHGCRQYQEENEVEGKKVFFRIKVADSILYYTQNRQKFKDIYCEIEISGKLVNIYDQLKENERVRFYFLKGTTRYGNDFKYYDHETQKTSSQYLYLQTTNSTIFQLASTIGSLKSETAAFKEFVKENFKNTFLLTSVNMKNPETVNYYKNSIRRLKNEIDIIGIVLDPSPHKVYGCLSNGHIFQIMIHSNTFFTNIRGLEKKNSMIYFRNLKFANLENIPSENNSFLFSLHTFENSFLSSASSFFQEEVERLNLILKDKNVLQQYKDKISNDVYEEGNRNLINKMNITKSKRKNE